jgi:beta-lactamase class A
MSWENYYGLTLIMYKKFVPAVMFFAALLPACRKAIDLPTEFPTVPIAAASTPAPKLEYKHDAELEKQFAKIAAEAKGRVGAAAIIIETGEAAFLKANEHYPMQSVYKLPIAMAVMEKVKLGQLDLEEKVAVTKDEFVRAGQRSPLRDKNPDGGEFTIRELMRLALVESDGTASDVLLRVGGGPDEVQSYLTQIGITDMKVVNTERSLDWNTQYDNWATPAESAELLRWLHKASDCGCSEIDPLTKPAEELEGPTLLIKFMVDSQPGSKRLKGRFSNDITVAHKTGTGGTRDGIAAATNDIGIIKLPDGSHLAIAVFVSDSPASEPTREDVIANIAKAAWDRWQ